MVWTFAKSRRTYISEETDLLDTNWKVWKSETKNTAVGRKP